MKRNFNSILLILFCFVIACSAVSCKGSEESAAESIESIEITADNFETYFNIDTWVESNDVTLDTSHIYTSYSSLRYYNGTATIMVVITPKSDFSIDSVCTNININVRGYGNFTHWSSNRINLSMPANGSPVQRSVTSKTTDSYFMPEYVKPLSSSYEIIEASGTIIIRK